jgi:hypothetical protein
MIRRGFSRLGCVFPISPFWWFLEPFLGDFLVAVSRPFSLGFGRGCMLEPSVVLFPVISEGLIRRTREGEWMGEKFFLKRTQPISQSQLRGSHTNKWKHTQTSLETLWTKLERLGSKAEASTKELEQKGEGWDKLGQPGQVTGSPWAFQRRSGSPRHKWPGQPTPSVDPAQVTGSLGIAKKAAREFAPNFQSIDLPNHLEYLESWDKILGRWRTPQGEVMPQKLRPQTPYNSRNRKFSPRALWPRVHPKVIESKAKSGVWRVKIIHKEAQGTHPWSPQRI